METALYDLESGYYSRRVHSFPDYVTAPNFGPYLGCAVAREIGRSWRLLPGWLMPKIFTLVEVGCGGEPHLSRSILETWQSEDASLFEKVQVILVDRSIARLDRAVRSLSAIYPGKVYGCPDLGQIPKITGAVISNELLDALPVRLIRKTAQLSVEEAYVEGETGRRRLVWRRCTDPVIVSFGLELADIGVAYPLNLEALRYLETAFHRLEHGLVMTIDFGDLRPAMASRSAVKAFSQKRIKEPNWDAPGSEDVTSPVDFSLLMEWGSRLGLETVQYETLSEFLIHNGINDFWKPPESREAIENNLRLKTLLLPYGFGEDFKVLLQAK